MAVSMTATKANLIKCKTRLSFSEKGYHLLDQKRTVLIREMMKLADESEKIQREIADAFAKAYQALQQATVSMGVQTIENYALTVTPEKSYTLRARSVMGVDIPELVLEEESSEMTHFPRGFSENNPALDAAINQFNAVKNLSYRLAEIEGIAYRLSREIRKTRKSANALDQIQIPMLQRNIKMIQESIEEKEREENFRIRKVKNLE